MGFSNVERVQIYLFFGINKYAKTMANVYNQMQEDNHSYACIKFCQIGSIANKKRLHENQVTPKVDEIAVLGHVAMERTLSINTR